MPHPLIVSAAVRILLLGGTAFVGRAIAEAALRSGAEITLFGRGRTGTELFPGVPRLTGDRDTGDYAALRGGEWDVVIDVSGYVPRHVAQAMAAIGDNAGRYVFISSQAVYRHEGLKAGAAEDAPRQAPLRGTEEMAGGNYGRLKVACEDDVLARYGDRATIVRPGKVAGPHDWQDGLTYWVRYGAHGGLIAMCADVAGTQIELVRVPENTAPPYFPLIRPVWATQQRSAAKARAAGMPATPLPVTIADVLSWDRERGEPPLDRGFTPQQQARVLARFG